MTTAWSQRNVRRGVPLEDSRAAKSEFFGRRGPAEVASRYRDPARQHDPRRARHADAADPTKWNDAMEHLSATGRTARECAAEGSTWPTRPGFVRTRDVSSHSLYRFRRGEIMRFDLSFPAGPLPSSSARLSTPRRFRAPIRPRTFLRALAVPDQPLQPVERHRPRTGSGRCHAAPAFSARSRCFLVPVGACGSGTSTSGTPSAVASAIVVPPARQTTRSDAP